VLAKKTGAAIINDSSGLGIRARGANARLQRQHARADILNVAFPSPLFLSVLFSRTASCSGCNRTKNGSFACPLSGTSSRLSSPRSVERVSPGSMVREKSSRLERSTVDERIDQKIAVAKRQLAILWQRLARWR